MNSLDNYNMYFLTKVNFLKFKLLKKINTLKIIIGNKIYKMFLKITAIKQVCTFFLKLVKD